MQTKKLLLSLIMMLCMAGSVKALEQVGDVYQIGTPQDLRDFAALVNDGTTGANAVLTADINMSGQSWPNSIGNWIIDGRGYAGHFDGQSHAITNLVYTTTRDFHGLFGVLISGAVVENFSISGTVTNSNYTQIGVVGHTRETSVSIRNVKSALNFNNSREAQIGGIVGHADNGTTNIERCSYSGTITSIYNSDDNGNYAGIVGNVNTASAIVNITNCLFDGTCQATYPNRCAVGGIIGFCSAGTVDITYCLSVGSVISSDTNYGQFFGVISTGKIATYNYSYYKGSSINGSRNGGTPSGSVTEVTDAQLASGEVCFRLNNNSQGNTNWLQTIGTDARPKPGHSDAINTVFCTKRSPEPEYVNLDFIDRVIQINNATELTYYSQIVNDFGSYALDAKLNADVTADANFAPIGTDSKRYSGTFEGNGHTVTLNVNTTVKGTGFCGITQSGATIRNLIIDGTIQSSQKWLAGIIGLSWGGATIQNVLVKATLKSTVSGDATCGGFIGDAEYTNNITNCAFVGSFDMPNGTTVGGAIGWTNTTTTFTNCLIAPAEISTAAGEFADLSYHRDCHLIFPTAIV